MSAPSAWSDSGAFSSNLASSPLAALASTYVVNSTGNTADFTVGNGICETATGNGVCTLRAAVQESNASAAQQDTITFNIAGAGPHTINSPTVPVITDPVTIDGTTEPDYVAAPIVELKGTGTGIGLQITAGSSTVRGLVVNRFATGIALETAGGNVIEGNYVGPDVTGTTSMNAGNTNQGVVMRSGSSNNVVGGTTAAARNVLSANAYGVAIGNVGVTGNVVAGNYIGLNAAGTAALQNTTGAAIGLSAAGNYIGGTTGTTPGGSCTGACNVISGNSTNGVHLEAGATAANYVEGNFIGLNPAGTATFPNNTRGVYVQGSNQVIGGTSAAARNVISDNGPASSARQVRVVGGTGNVVQGNFIGTNSAGTADVTATSGCCYGVEVGGANLIGGTAGTTPGGPCTGACNVISGNDHYGIAIISPAGPTIQGNFIGTNPSGTGAVPNSGGIRTNVAGPGNTIGGTTPAERNVISGNNAAGGGEAGVLLITTGNVLQGNFIGTTSDGNSPLLNGSWGVDVVVAGNTVGGTTGVTPGGPCTGACNVLTSVVIRGDGTVLQGNFSGLNVAGTAAIGGGPIQLGGDVSNSVINVLIGGDTPQERNVISGHNGAGVDFLHSSNNMVQGNYIGVGTDGSTPVPNTGHGVQIRPQGTGNLVGGANAGEGNVIANNGGDGVWMDCRGAYTSQGHRVLANSIHSNGQLGIDFCNNGVNVNDAGDSDNLEPNNGQNYPVVSSPTASGNGLAVAGTLNSNANQQFVLDFYGSEDCDPSGYGEGRTYLGSTTVNTVGTSASFSLTLPADANSSVVTATATNTNGSTSEFSQCRDVLAPRPGSGTPLRAPLVLAYDACTSPNSQHVGPLNDPSCTPQVQTSDELTTSQGRQGAFVRFTDILGDPMTPADEADLAIEIQTNDVRKRSDSSDYAGPVIMRTLWRMTDRANGPSGTAIATVQDGYFSFPITCVTTPSSPTFGSNCNVTTTADTLLPGVMKESKRTILAFLALDMLDAGADASITPPSGSCPPTCGSGDEETYLEQGVFVP